MDEKLQNSATITLYYKGHSILLTDRSSGADMLELANRQFALIDGLIENESVKPSWNSSTNKEVAKETDGDPGWIKSMDNIAKDLYTKCLVCGQPGELKSGNYKTKPGTWKGVFCSTGDRTHTKYI